MILFLFRIKTLHAGFSDFHQHVSPFVFLSELCVRPHVLFVAVLMFGRSPSLLPTPGLWLLVIKARCDKGQLQPGRGVELS